MSDSAPALKKLAKNRKFEELEAACLERIEAGTVDLEELLSAVRVASHRAEEDWFENFLWLMLSTWAEHHGAAAGLDVGRGTADILPESGLVAEQVIEMYAEAHPDFPDVRGVAATLAANRPLPEAMEVMDALLTLPAGSYFTERGRKEPGRVLGVVEEGEALEVEIGGKTRRIEPRVIPTLVPLPADSFLALAAFEKERLANMAEEDPVKLVEMLLRTHGPSLNYRGIRTHLVDVVPGNWTTWWNAARPRIRRSEWIEASSGTQPVLELRKVPLDHRTRVRRELMDAEAGYERLVLILDYLDEAGEHLEGEAELIGELAAAIEEQAASEDPSVAVATMAVLVRLSRESGGVVAAPEGPLPLDDRSPPELLYAVPDPRLETGVLELVRAGDAEGWPDFFAAALPGLSADVCEEAAAALTEAGRGDDLYDVAETIMAHPLRFPEALIWLWREVGAGNLPPESGGPDGAELLIHVATALDRAGRSEEGKGQLFNKLRSALSSRNFATVRTVMERADMEDARAVQAALQRGLGIPDLTREHLTDVLVETHPKLFVSEVAAWEQEDVLWSTRAGIIRRKADLDRLVNDRLPEIAKAIGVAAGHGDLSENAEYTAALEERARLTERANSLQAELTKAREIPPELTKSDRVTVGSRVVARRLDTGEERVFLFLGPWDANIEEGIYSYRAPASQAFMGRKAGDVAVVTTGSEEVHWTIQSVEPGI